jgi:hypothetical protein
VYVCCGNKEAAAGKWRMATYWRWREVGGEKEPERKEWKLMGERWSHWLGGVLDLISVKT